MTGITHKQAGRYLRAAADGLIRDNQRTLLDAHLRDCASCRAEADKLNALEARLKNNFQARWDAHDGPSRNVMANIHSRSRRIILTNQINVGLRTFAGITALLVLGFAVSFAISRLRNTTIAAPVPQTTGDATSVFSTETDGRLLAFTSGKDGNSEIYTMHADGSGLTNLTNHSAKDVNPVWSPDGKRIAFESDRNGFKQIFVMNADGSNVIQLTDDKADHALGVSYGGNHDLWSPDGSRLIFLQIAPVDGKEMLYTMDANGANKKLLVEDPGIDNSSWSPDDKHIAFVVREEVGARIHVVDANGTNLMSTMKLLPADEDLDSFNYSWSRDGQSISFIAGRRSWENGHGKFTAYEASLDGERLIEKATSSTPMESWWDGTSFIRDFDTSTLTWLRSDGYNTFRPLENCQPVNDFQIGLIAARSPNGNLMINISCPNGAWFYWANPKGTIVKQLLDSPIPAKDGGLANMIWSPDDKFIAFNIAYSDNTYLYVVNIEKSLNDPSIQPLKIELGRSPSWQPVVNNNITEEKPTSEHQTFSLTIQEVEALAGFDVLEPTYLPEGYTFQGAGYGLQAQEVTLTYASPLVDPIGQGRINIYQQRGGFPSDQTLPSHATPVPVGDVMGEFSRGVWIYESGATTPRWDGSADYYALSWQKDGISFMVDFIGGEGIPNIQLKGLRDIAESLKHIVTQNMPTLTPDKSSPTTAPQETSRPFRFGIPIESESHALIAAESGVRTAFSYVKPLTLVTVKLESYGEWLKQTGQRPPNQPADVKVWLVVYFNNEWRSTFIAPTNAYNDQGQFVPIPLEARTPAPPFSGCVYIAINADDGSALEIGGPLQKGIMTECDK